jgi:hypothetical protein
MMGARHLIILHFSLLILNSLACFVPCSDGGVSRSGSFAGGNVLPFGRCLPFHKILNSSVPVPDRNNRIPGRCQPLETVFGLRMSLILAKFASG